MLTSASGHFGSAARGSWYERRAERTVIDIAGMDSQRMRVEVLLLPSSNGTAPVAAPKFPEGAGRFAVPTSVQLVGQELQFDRVYSEADSPPTVAVECLGNVVNEFAAGTNGVVYIGGEADDAQVKQPFAQAISVAAAVQLFSIINEAKAEFPDDPTSWTVRISMFTIGADESGNEQIMDALAAAAGVGAVSAPASGPFSPGGRLHTSLSQSKSGLQGSIILSPRRDQFLIPVSTGVTGDSSLVEAMGIGMGASHTHTNGYTAMPSSPNTVKGRMLASGVDYSRVGLGKGSTDLSGTLTAAMDRQVSAAASAAAAQAAAVASSGLQMRDDPIYGSATVPGLWEVECEGPEDVSDLLASVSLCSHTGGAGGGVLPSRTHSVVHLTLHCRRAETSKDLYTGSTVETPVDTYSRLSIVRLARASGTGGGSTGAPSSAQQHAGVQAGSSRKVIPPWVLALSEVLSGIEKKAPRVPFAASKATQLLRDGLSGRVPSVFIALVPNQPSVALATLQFAARVRNTAGLLCTAFRKAKSSTTSDMLSPTRAFAPSHVVPASESPHRERERLHAHPSVQNGGPVSPVSATTSSSARPQPSTEAPDASLRFAAPKGSSPQLNEQSKGSAAAAAMSRYQQLQKKREAEARGASAVAWQLLQEEAQRDTTPLVNLLPTSPYKEGLGPAAAPAVTLPPLAPAPAPAPAPLQRKSSMKHAHTSAAAGGGDSSTGMGSGAAGHNSSFSSTGSGSNNNLRKSVSFRAHVQEVLYSPPEVPAEGTPEWYSKLQSRLAGHASPEEDDDEEEEEEEANEGRRQGHLPHPPRDPQGEGRILHQLHASNEDDEDDEEQEEEDVHVYKGGGLGGSSSSSLTGSVEVGEGPIHPTHPVARSLASQLMPEDVAPYASEPMRTEYREGSRAPSSSSSSSYAMPLASPTGRTGVDLGAISSDLASTSRALFASTLQALQKSREEIASLKTQVEQLATAQATEEGAGAGEVDGQQEGGDGHQLQGAGETAVQGSTMGQEAVKGRAAVAPRLTATAKARMELSASKRVAGSSFSGTHHLQPPHTLSSQAQPQSLSMLGQSASSSGLEPGRHAELQQHVTALRAQVERLTAANSSLSKKERDFELYREVVESSIGRLQKDVQRVAGERDAAQKTAKKAAEQASKDRQALMTAKKRISELEALVAALEQQTQGKEAAAKAVGQLRAALREARSLSANNEATIEMVQAQADSEVTALRQALAQARADWQVEHTRAEEVETELELLRAKLSVGQAGRLTPRSAAILGQAGSASGGKHGASTSRASSRSASPLLQALSQADGEDAGEMEEGQGENGGNVPLRRPQGQQASAANGSPGGAAAAVAIAAAVQAQAAGLASGASRGRASALSDAASPPAAFKPRPSGASSTSGSGASSSGGRAGSASKKPPSAPSAGPGQASVGSSELYVLRSAGGSEGRAATTRQGHQGGSSDSADLLQAAHSLYAEIDSALAGTPIGASRTSRAKGGHGGGLGESSGSLSLSSLDLQPAAGVTRASAIPAKPPAAPTARVKPPAYTTAAGKPRGATPLRKR